MNDLQKKLAIVGSTAFIYWFLLGYFISGGLKHISDIDEFIGDFITYLWYQTFLFATWVGSLIAFNIYKD